MRDINFCSLIRKNLLKLLLICCLPILFNYCSMFSKKKSIDFISPMERDYQGIMAKYKKEKFNDVIILAQQFIYNYPGSEYSPEVQFILANSYFKTKQYELAADEYKFLIETFNKSKYLEESYYKYGVCYYKLSYPAQKDPEYTYKGIDELNTFISLFPKSEYCEDAKKKIAELREKIAKKQYVNGEVYLKLEKYNAAEIYFQIVIDDYSDCPKWYEKSLLCMGITKFYLKDYENYEKYFDVLISSSSNEKIKKEAIEWKEKLKKSQF